MMEPHQCKHIIVSGVVQGVGFRYFVLETARELGLRGWVRNLANGDVEIEAEGPAELMESFIAAVRKGPRMSHITGLDIEDLPCENRYHNFSVR
jgi:acylphosphatase